MRKRIKTILFAKTVADNIINMENNTLYLVWTDEKTGKKAYVGKLMKSNKGYSFSYINKTDGHGYNYLAPFNDRKKVYESLKMFAPFANRLPDRKRVDIDDILKKYGLTTYDEFELLRKTKSKLPIDSYSFEETMEM